MAFTSKEIKWRISDFHFAVFWFDLRLKVINHYQFLALFSTRKNLNSYTYPHFE